jgi:hypothetical protein
MKRKTYVTLGKKKKKERESNQETFYAGIR